MFLAVSFILALFDCLWNGESVCAASRYVNDEECAYAAAEWVAVLIRKIFDLNF